MKVFFSDGDLFTALVVICITTCQPGNQARCYFQWLNRTVLSLKRFKTWINVNLDIKLFREKLCFGKSQKNSPGKHTCTTLTLLDILILQRFFRFPRNVWGSIVARILYSFRGHFGILRRTKMWQHSLSYFDIKKYFSSPLARSRKKATFDAYLTLTKGP